MTKNDSSGVFPRESPADVVKQLFINTDNQDWQGVKACFASNILLDYTSFGEGEPVQLTPDQIVDSWSKFLPKFDFTHHQIGNVLISVKEENAEAFCYGMAVHYKENDSGNNVWTVVGSYRFHLIKMKNTWRIDKMKFNYKFQHGNKNLPKIVGDSRE